MTNSYLGRLHRWGGRTALILGLLLGAFLLITSSNAWVPPRPAATAQQVEAARTAFRVARQSRLTGQPSDLVLGAGDLDSLSAMVSQGFEPKRLDMKLSNGVFIATASQPLLGRWLNLRAEATGRSQGFPAFRARIGAFPVPAWLSRVGVEIGRRLLIFQGAQIPPLDVLVQSTSVAHDHVKARIFLPKSGLLNQVLADPALQITDTVVARIYCRLTALQRAAPDRLFAHQLHRALMAAEPTAAQHGAALVALAMLVTDPRVGELVGDTPAKVRACLIPVPLTTLQGRSDSPKHWSVSAALTVATGGHLAVAMGEWKELADSLSQSDYLTHNDRSGFSFVDLATDRAGFLAGRQLTSSSRLGAARARLLAANDGELLPISATNLNDGMRNAEFVRRFGGTDDPRFRAALIVIDGDLQKVGLD